MRGSTGVKAFPANLWQPAPSVDDENAPALAIYHYAICCYRRYVDNMQILDRTVDFERHLERKKLTRRLRLYGRPHQTWTIFYDV